MKIAYEMDMNNFKAWCGAVSTLERIQEEGKVAELEALIEEMWCDREYIDEVEINDFLWFDWEMIFENLGIKDEDEEIEDAEDD